MLPITWKNIKTYVWFYFVFLNISLWRYLVIPFPALPYSSVPLLGSPNLAPTPSPNPSSHTATASYVHRTSRITWERTQAQIERHWVTRRCLRFQPPSTCSARHSITNSCRFSGTKFMKITGTYNAMIYIISSINKHDNKYIPMKRHEWNFRAPKYTKKGPKRPEWIFIPGY